MARLLYVHNDIDALTANAEAMQHEHIHRAGVPIRVWAGSTNFTDSGFFCRSTSALCCVTRPSSRPTPHMSIS
jgi:hypothetical protein